MISPPRRVSFGECEATWWADWFDSRTRAFGMGERRDEISPTTRNALRKKE